MAHLRLTSIVRHLLCFTQFSQKFEGLTLVPPTKPILITGPTASGKSGLAIGLAERLGGVIINSDSMQVYSDLSLLTARTFSR